MCQLVAPHCLRRSERSEESSGALGESPGALRGCFCTWRCDFGTARGAGGGFLHRGLLFLGSRGRFGYVSAPGKVVIGVPGALGWGFCPRDCNLGVPGGATGVFLHLCSHWGRLGLRSLRSVILSGAKNLRGGADGCGGACNLARNSGVWVIVFSV